MEIAMDHPTPQPLFPCLPPDSKLFQQIAAFRRWLDSLLSFSCKTVLVMQASFLRWVKEDDSARNREWIGGISEAFQHALAGEL
jgi:hypothetical protein